MINIRWLLLTMWIVLNLLDLGLSWIGMEIDASEVGLLYRLSSSWTIMAMNKVLLSGIIGGILVYFKKDSWLALLNLGMLGICIYSGLVLIVQVRDGW